MLHIPQPKMIHKFAACVSIYVQTINRGTLWTLYSLETPIRPWKSVLSRFLLEAFSAFAFKGGQQIRYSEPSDGSLGTLSTRCVSLHECSVVWLQFQQSQQNRRDTEIKDPSVENPKLKGSPFKVWSMSEYIHPCLTYCQDFFPELISTFPVHSPSFF